MSALKLRQKPKTGSQMNKRLIAVILVIIILFIGFVFIQALSTNSQDKNTSTSIANSGATPSPKKTFAALPSSYQDTKKLNQYYHASNQTLADEIKQLKAQQAALASRMQKTHSSSNFSTTDSQTQQAISSNMYFPNTEPKTNNNNTISPASTTNGGKAAPKPTEYEAQNMQGQKINFINNDSDDAEAIYNQHQLVKPISPYEIQAGTIIPATLITAVNTSLPGEAVAQIRENVYNSVNGKYLLIPKGSRLVGQYDSQVSYGQNRVLLVFNRIIRPDGSSILLSKAQGTDLFGQSGIEGDVNNHWGRVIGSSVLSTVLSLGAGATADNNFSKSAYYPSAIQNAVYSAGGQVSQVGQSLANRSINIQPTLILKAGYEFNIIVNKDMVLNPYDKH